MPHVIAENPFLPVLRDRHIPISTFREASQQLSALLIDELEQVFRQRKVDPSLVIFVAILRSAMVLLDAALRAFPSAHVGVAGLRRDEATAVAHWYYEKFPPIDRTHTIVVLDPMLATGGSAEEAVLKLKSLGADLQKIYFVGTIAAPEGIARLSQYIPEQNILLAAVDKELDAKKFIVPGLGDFGDRYFGYSDNYYER